MPDQSGGGENETRKAWNEVGEQFTRARQRGIRRGAVHMHGREPHIFRCRQVVPQAVKLEHHSYFAVQLGIVPARIEHVQLKEGCGVGRHRLLVEIGRRRRGRFEEIFVFDFIQRANRHAWRNDGDQPCRVAVVMIGLGRRS